MIPQIGQKIQNVKRYHEILSVLIKHGFKDFIISTELDRRLGLEKTALNPGPIAKDKPRSERIREVLEELGPTFIKLGQIMSTRPDLIPADWAEELKKLQSDCAPVEFSEIEKRIEEEFGEKKSEIFAYIDPERLASASMAQVHRATLIDGTKVVVKVLRPGIHDEIRTDLDILSGLAEFAERHFEEMGYSATEVVQEFSRELEREVDLSHEGRSTDRLREYFKNDPKISFTKIYWAATTKNILTMDEVDGTQLSKVNPEDLSLELREQLAANGTDAIVRQCLEFGFFHADPHPGNIFIRDDGSICFIDCGMTGHIDESTAEELANLIIGVDSADLEKVLGVIRNLTQSDPQIFTERRLRSETWDLISRFQQSSFEKLHFGEVLRDFFDLMGRNNIRLPSDIVFLTKAITTIEGVGAWLAPEFDVVGRMQPYVKQLVERRYGYKGIKKRTERTLLQYAELAEELPGEIQGFLAQLRGNHFSVNLEHKRLDRLTNTLEHASANISISLVILGLFTAAAILVLAGSVAPQGGQVFQTLGTVGIIAGLVGILILMVRFFRYRKK